MLDGYKVLDRLLGLDTRLYKQSTKRVSLTDQSNPNIGVILQFDEKGFAVAISTKKLEVPTFKKVAGVSIDPISATWQTADGSEVEASLLLAMEAALNDHFAADRPAVSLGENVLRTK